ncbi:DUF368 domain-containing protein [Candidatus Nanohalobium constans]|uniref:Putative transmembrane protein n=1 Tax=Candidatus Nanohalobium constans TaxID=2565781 RepID=A0A5Q0UH97_9ARCH|nr:DUF368 domain-containing protein [Candidatus Nanohalobium constans]QGA80279.1 putative transmembrane protein [Candidatus Nanohalobium constans]
MSSENCLEWLYIFLKGMAMGAADAVPGVSGGTIALITGIYERFIHAITSVGFEDIIEVLDGFRTLDFSVIVQKFEEADGRFLMVLGAGILTAILTVLQLVHYLLSNYAVLTYGFFFGLIAASVIALYQKIEVSELQSVLAAVTGFILSFMASGYASTSMGHGLPVIFVAGVVAICAMVLPGISGSLLLIILGQYEYMVGALSKFFDSLLSGNSLIESSVPVITFSSGAVVGVLTVSHVVKWALENYREMALVFLVSLVAGALRAPIVEIGKVLANTDATWVSVMPEFASAALAGFAAVLVLDYKAGVVEI